MAQLFKDSNEAGAEVRSLGQSRQQRDTPAFAPTRATAITPPQEEPAPAPAPTPQDYFQALGDRFSQLTAAGQADQEPSPENFFGSLADKYMGAQQAPVQAKAEPGIASDVGNLLGLGVNNLALSVRELVGRIPGVGKSIVDGLDSIDKWATGTSSEQLLQKNVTQGRTALSTATREAQEKEWWDSDKGTFGSAWLDPRSYMAGVFQSLPEQAVTMFPVMRLAKGVYAARVAAGAAPEAAAAAAARAATVAGGVSEGLLAGAGSSREVRDKIMKMTPEQLGQSDAMRMMVESGMDFETARSTLAEDAATQAFILSGTVTGAFGGLGDRFLAKAITSGVGKTVMGRAAKGVLTEGLEEFPQEYGSAVAENFAMQSADPSIQLTEGALNQGLGGLAIGGLQGGAVTAAFGKKDEQSRKRTAISSDGPVTVSYPVDEKGDPVRNEELDKRNAELSTAVDTYLAPSQDGTVPPSLDPALDTAEGATNYLQRIVDQAPPQEADTLRDQLVSRVIADIEARDGVASPDEAAFLDAHGMGRPYDSIDTSIPSQRTPSESPSGIVVPDMPYSARPSDPGIDPDAVAAQERQDAIRAERKAAEAARVNSAIAATSRAPVAPDIDATIAALKVTPALRTTEQRLTVSQAQSRFEPEDLELIQRQALNGALITAPERVRLQELRRSTVAPAPVQAAEPTVAPVRAERRSSEPVDLSLPAPVQPTRQVATPDQRIAAAAAQGRLAQQPKGMILTSDAKLSTRRRPVPGSTLSIKDGGTDHVLNVVPNSKMGVRGKLLEQIGRIFGKRLVSFQSDTLQADGFVLDDDNQNIYVNINSEVSPLAVFGHELLHQLKRDNPQAYIALEAVIRRNIKESAEMDAEYAGYDADSRTEEVTADLVGNRFQDPNFWADVFGEIESLYPAESRGIIAKLRDALVNAVAAFKAAVGQSGYKADNFVKDLDGVTKAIQETFVQYAQDQRIAAQQMEAGLTPSASAGDNISTTNIGSSNAKFTNARANGREPEISGRDRSASGSDRSGQAGLPDYGTPREGAVSAVGRHYSPVSRESLSGDFYGTGMRGAERHRLENARDERIRRRINFYIDNGNGITPESSVGSYAHEVKLNNLYDPDSRLIPLQIDVNNFESAVIDAGFDGYISKNFGRMDAAVLLGPQHTDVPVKALGQLANVQTNSLVEQAPATLRKSLLSRELREVNPAAIPGAQIKDGSLEIPFGEKESANAEMERIGSPVRFSKIRPIPEDIDSFATLSTVVPRAREGSYNKNRELKVDLQKAILAAAKAAGVDLSAQNAETEKYLVRVGVADALYAIQSNANAVGWYDKTVTKALRVLGAIHPEINTDPNAKFAFTWGLAVTSNGLKVDKNFELAERAYKDYKRTGQMPTNIKAGQAQAAINEGLDLFNVMVAQYGIDQVRKFMETNFTVTQIKRATGLEITGEAAETTVRGAAVLGPKIGNGFFSNLNGFFDQLTMDRWLMRTWGRWTGTLIEERPDMIRAKRAELRDLILEIKKDNQATENFQKALGRRLVVGDLDNIALAIQKASMLPTNRQAFNQTKVGEKLRKTGNALAKYMDGQKEAPSGPDERNFIRKIFSGILEEVRAKGFPSLTMSDLQALLWYPEKRLYDIAKSDEDAQTGYSDDEAPDYANAAIKLARANGVADSDIQQAISTAEQEYETRNSAGSTRRDAGEQQTQASTQEGVRGFTPRERREFLTTGTIHRVRSDRQRDGEASGPYKRKGGGDGPGLRVLGQPTVAIHSPDVKFKNALSAVPAAAPKFYEFSSPGAQLFQDAIRASKDSSPFGAAVYVYPIEDYEGMRLFLTDDAKAGFALKGDDIVSVFSGQTQRGSVHAMMQLAIQEGGRRLDAFDTVLPDLYSVHGFRIVARTPWDDNYRPDGWVKSVFSEYKNGEPDVVFMTYDESYFGRPTNNDGVLVKNYDDGTTKQLQALGIDESAPTDGATTDPSAADQNIKFSLRRKPAPEKTVTAYKLFRVDPRRPGQLFPLFVNANDPVDIGTWLDADIGEQNDKGKVKSKLGPLAFRPGWHAGDLPIATHIGGKSDSALTAPDTRPDNQVWAEVEMAADRDWQSEATARARRNKDGEIILNTAHITDQIPEDGFYRYKTNANMTGSWLIGGSMKVNRILSDTEVEQINSAAGTADLPRAQPFDAAKYGFDTQFSRRRPQVKENIYGDPVLSNWTAPQMGKWDDKIRYMQDKQIDTKRVIKAINDEVGQIEDKFDVYLKEELFYGRAATQTKEFLAKEVKPLLEDMDKRGVKPADLETYLHNRHAETRNKVIAARTPSMPDGGSGIYTADARAYLAALSPQERANYEALAKRVDAITKGTREFLVASGVETRESIDLWEQQFPDYVPLFRAEGDYNPRSSNMGTGSGFSVQGASSKKAKGSTAEVTDILANIMQQRERAIVRGEKTRVGRALFGLAVTNPNPDFWLAVKPGARNDADLDQKLIALGLDPADARNLMAAPDAGRDYAMAVRIGGEDHFIFFNNRNERAKAMVESLKNINADQLGRVMGSIGKFTRYFANINTQYNPIFGMINLIRDTGSGLLNLTTTGINDKKSQVMADIMPAMKGIYGYLRETRRGNAAPQNEWAKLWQQFTEIGGQTGYRDQYSNSEQRAEALATELKRLQEGKPIKSARAVFDWLSDYNETLENAVRLSSFKAALDKGMTPERAASIAKNLTVNFNRKGEVATQAGAFYAFFNASMQGTARLYETLTGPAGKKILAGGFLLGAMQALALSLAGYEEDEPPDFVKERNFIIPLGFLSDDLKTKYVTIPLPLGFNVIPNAGRVVTEWALSGFKDPSKRVLQIAGSLLETFNPIGNSGWSAQTIAPTIADPFIALTENRDFTGKPIYRKNMSDLDPEPGYLRARDSANAVTVAFSKFLNQISGGTEFKPGNIDITPDAIEYLIGQATGGVGRELMKIVQTGQNLVTGEETEPYKVPIAGRFFGDTESKASTTARFYSNVTELNKHLNEIEGRRKSGQEVSSYIQENPEATMSQAVRRYTKTIGDLKKARDRVEEQGGSRDAIKYYDNRITEVMQQLNDRVKELKK